MVIKKTKLHKKDLVLKVSNNYDINNINFDDWENYINILCKNREYQKEAIIKSLIYLIGGNYKSLEELAIENFNNNSDISDYYKSEARFKSELIFKDKLFANIELVTGSGKSYVIYGIAQIMLSLGFVDKVLVLCPTVTIEDGLKEKFLNLSSDINLMKSIPSYSKISSPSIVDANQFINTGDICVENIHSVYEKTNSSISDSFKGDGHRTLVLNDESHHIYTSSEGKVWSSFLLSTSYNFKYMLGFTGTPYIDNEYLVDVIYRYSFKQAHEEKVIKNVNYIAKGKPFKDDNEKFQVIIKIHDDNKQMYFSEKIKPLTMFVTTNIKSSTILGETFAQHLTKYKIDSGDTREFNIILTESKNSILVINYTSSTEEKVRLSKVDDYYNTVEYIIGISMLNEGWDVKNIFQIVPMEEKAFNSKLLISQVLGRGLRIPLSLTNQPTVTVINHEKWSANIQPFLEDVIKLDPKISIKSLTKEHDRFKHNFELHNLIFKKKQTQEKKPIKDVHFDLNELLENGIPLVSEGISKDLTLGMLDIGGNQKNRTFKTRRTTYTIEETINKIFTQLSYKINDMQALNLVDTVYDKSKFTKEVVYKIIEKSIENSSITDGVLTDENQNRILTAFEPVLNQGCNIIVYKPELNNIKTFSSETIRDENIGIGAFRDLEKPRTLFFTDKKIEEAMEDVNIFNIKEFVLDKTYPEFAKKSVNNFSFKTPTNYVVTQSTPELEFVSNLCEPQVSKNIDSWIKSKNVGFYSIEYKEINNNNEIISSMFNPDFFIKIIYKNLIYISVVEIKADDDITTTNKAKSEYAKTHFSNLNEELAKNGISQIYLFNFLSPKSYYDYFKCLTDRTLLSGKFHSSLDVDLLDLSIKPKII